MGRASDAQKNGIAYTVRFTDDQKTVAHVARTGTKHLPAAEQE